MITWAIYEVVTASEADIIAKKQKGTIRKYCNLGYFEANEARKSGGTWLITRQGIERFLKDKKKKATLSK